jgi:plasmid maintenance system killer protein
LFFSPTGKLDHPSFGIAKYTDYRLKGFELRKAICIRESSIFSHARFISHFYPRLQAAKPDVERVLKLFYLILTHSIGTRPHYLFPSSFKALLTSDILDRLDAAKVVKDMNFPGSDLHRLKGKMKDLWSVKVSGNWRVVFSFKEGNADNVDYIDYH